MLVAIFGNGVVVWMTEGVDDIIDSSQDHEQDCSETADYRMKMVEVAASWRLGRLPVHSLRIAGDLLVCAGSKVPLDLLVLGALRSCGGAATAAFERFSSGGCHYCRPTLICTVNL